MNALQKLLLIGLPLFLPMAAAASVCSCVSVPIATQARFATLVFSGKVVGVTKDSAWTRYKIVPIKTWRGPQTDTVFLKTSRLVLTADLAVGQRYVLLPNSSQDITLCDGAYTGTDAAEASARLDQLFTRRRYRRGPARP